MSLIDVDIESLAPGGDAFGRQVGGKASGRATFVPLAAPGERVRARLVREKRDVAWAELVEVVRPSPVRVQPPCPLFGACGGCQWQHVDIDAQRAAKLEIVKRALRFDAVMLRTPSPAFGYRDRAKLVAVKRSEKLVVGFKRRQSHEVIDVPLCPLLSPAASTGLAAIRDAASSEGDAFIQASPNGSVAFRMTSGSSIIDANGTTSAGAALDIAEAGEPPLQVAVGGFAQVGASANRALVASVLSHVGDEPRKVLELYAGAGNFTRFLVQRGAMVVASDGDAASVALGRQNVPQADWRLPDAIDVAESFDVVVVDPPRAGLDPLAFDLARMANEAIIYVSCDPQTLGRDVRRLAEFGFHVAAAEALDLMPQTHHVEVVVRLERAS